MLGNAAVNVQLPVVRDFLAAERVADARTGPQQHFMLLHLDLGEVYQSSVEFRRRSFVEKMLVPIHPIAVDPGLVIHHRHDPVPVGEIGLLERLVADGFLSQPPGLLCRGRTQKR